MCVDWPPFSFTPPFSFFPLFHNNKRATAGGMLRRLKGPATAATFEETSWKEMEVKRLGGAAINTVDSQQEGCWFHSQD